jgi:tRNA pseudouridine55 synthase
MLEVSDNNIRENGEILFVDKPLDWTSFDVVKKVRTLFKVKKAGHAGTLDPKATGLLIVCLGSKTKIIEKYVGLEKEYMGTCELGIKTASYDRETEVYERKDAASVKIKDVTETAKSFLGIQMQIPPMYSAAKYGGIPLYQYARSGKIVDRSKREIDVVKFDIESFNNPYIDFRITCSKGTYIRSLINEFGLRLGCGAVLNSLRRIRIGNYTIDDAMTIDKLIEWRNSFLKSDVILDESH